MNTRPRFGKNTALEQEYWKAVITAVNNYFKNSSVKRIGGYQVKLKALLFFTILLTGVYILYFFGSELGAWQVLGIYTVVLAPMAAFIGMNTMHEGSHGTFSSVPWLNTLAGSISLLFVGGLPINWKTEHVVLHHPYTNIYGVDEDISTAESTLRFSRFSLWKKLHRFQKHRMYIFVLYCQMTLNWIIATDIKQTQRYLRYKKIGYITDYPSPSMAWTQVVLAKIFLLLFWIYIPIAFGGIDWWLVALGFFLMHQVMGMILSHIFQPAHINEHALKYDLESFPGSSSLTHQFLTSTDFATRSKLITFLTGGLNHQKVHHIFPNITHEHYPQITQIMEELSEKFKKKYPNFVLEYFEFPTLWSAIRANYRYIKSHSEEVKISLEV